MTEFDAKLAECRPRLVAYARRHLPPAERDLGSDYVQDALLDAQDQRELLYILSPEQTFALLLAYLKWRMRNAVRARHQAKRDPSRVCRLDAVPPEVLVDHEPSPVEMACEAELDERIRVALRRLTDRQHAAIVLKVYGD